MSPCLRPSSAAPPLITPFSQPLSTLPLLTCTQLREAEARHVREPLMSRAGNAAASLIEALPGIKTGTRERGSIVVLCGPGNNGGDGLVTARLLFERGFAPHVVAPVPPPPGTEAARACDDYRAAGGVLHAAPPALPAAGPLLVVDALFGIGLNRAPAAPFAALIDWIDAAGADHGAFILALDVPSGLNADTGVAYSPAVVADATLTFIALKPGLLTLDGPDHCGMLYTATLDIVPQTLPLPPGQQALDRRFLDDGRLRTLHRRRRNVHKGTFGTLAILGGAPGMRGAPLLAGRAAVRLGAGKVRAGFPGAAGDVPAFDSGCLELMLHPAADLLAMPHSAWVAGCGLGDGDEARILLEGLLEVDAPLVLDADALNLVGQSPELAAAVARRSAPTLLTPHPAEAGRLLHCPTADIQEDRIAATLALARRYRAYALLKGNGSVIADPGGAFCINATGNPALAFGGSGDVLAGMIGALLAQGVDAAAALRYAVCLHGAAADALVERGQGPLGVLGGELIDAAAGLLNAATA